MLVYTIMLFLALFVAYKGKKYIFRTTNNKTIHLYNWIAMLPFWFVTCFRYQVGTDYKTYIELYATIIPNGSYESDFLFSLLVKFCVNFFNNKHLIIVFIGTLTIFLIGRFIQKNTENMVLSIILLFFTGTFSISLNLMKQMLATAIWLNSLQYIKERKFVKYMFLVLVAAGFHRIAFLYTFLYFFYEKPIPIKKSFPIFMAFIYIFNNQIRSIIITVTKWLDFYYGYFYNLYDKRQGSGALLVINIFAFIIIFKCFQNSQEKGIYLEKKFNFYYNIQFLCLFFCVLMSILPNGERIVYLLLPMQIVSIPSALQSIEKKKARYIMIVVSIAVYSMFFIELFIIKNMGATFPYRFIFSK